MSDDFLSGLDQMRTVNKFGGYSSGDSAIVGQAYKNMADDAKAYHRKQRVKAKALAKQDPRDTEFKDIPYMPEDPMDIAGFAGPLSTVGKKILSDLAGKTVKTGVFKGKSAMDIFHWLGREMGIVDDAAAIQVKKAFDMDAKVPSPEGMGTNKVTGFDPNQEHLLDVPDSGFAKKVKEPSEAKSINAQLIRSTRLEKLLGIHPDDPAKGIFAKPSLRMKDATKKILDDDFKMQGTAKIHPDDFLNLTTRNDIERRAIRDSNVHHPMGKHPKAKDGDKRRISVTRYNELDSQDGPYLIIDKNTGDIVGHQGRHRATSLLEEGGDEMEIGIKLKPGHSYLDNQRGIYAKDDIPTKFFEEVSDRGDMFRPESGFAYNSQKILDTFEPLSGSSVNKNKKFWIKNDVEPVSRSKDLENAADGILKEDVDLESLTEKLAKDAKEVSDARSKSEYDMKSAKEKAKRQKLLRKMVDGSEDPKGLDAWSEEDDWLKELLDNL